MNMAQINDEVKILIGKKVLEFGREVAMLWIEFDGFIDYKSLIDGKISERPKYALLASCHWRLFKDNKIVLAAHDMYWPPNAGDSLVDFDWDVQGNNRFDVRAREINAIMKEKGVTISTADASEFGDLTIQMTDGFCLQVLLCNSMRKEYWRILDFVGDRHIVVFEAED